MRVCVCVRAPFLMIMSIVRAIVGFYTERGGNVVFVIVSGNLSIDLCRCIILLLCFQQIMVTLFWSFVLRCLYFIIVNKIGLLCSNFRDN